jgi:chorismate synthase
MNTFGRLFQIAVYGESHGPEVGVLIDGCPAGLSLSAEDFLPDLEKRKAGLPGTTARREPDVPLIKSGLVNDRTTGAPLLIAFQNQDVQSQDYLDIRDTIRPGHADFAARRKFCGFNDIRGGGHFSGRLTVALTAAGVVAKKIISPITIESELLEAGGSRDIEAAVRSAAEAQDSIGGLIECRADGLPVGLGEPFFDSVESLISHLVFAIPGIKGIEFGSGFGCSRMRGSECNDAFIDSDGKTATNHAGGVNGGLTNGNSLVFRVAVKPPSSIAREQNTIDLRTNKPLKISIKGRHDICIALRMPVIVEAAAAVVLADLLMLEKKIPKNRGGDHEAGKNPDKD